jgi:hypothetical protein
MQLFGIITLFASVAVAAATLTKRGGPIGQVQLGSFNIAGDGCPPGTVTPALSDDLTMLSISYNSLTPMAGPGVPIANSRTFCLAVAALQIPQGWQFSIVKVNYLGFAVLPAGVTCKCEAQLDFSGTNQPVRMARFRGQDGHALLNSKQATSSSITLGGPLSGNFVDTDVLSAGSTVWSPCGSASKILNVESTNQISPQNPSEQASSTVCGNRARVRVWGTVANPPSLCNLDRGRSIPLCTGLLFAVEELHHMKPISQKLEHSGI